MTELEAARALAASQQLVIAQLLEEIAKLNDRVAELLAIAQRKHRKPSLPRPPEPPPTLDADARARFADRPLPPAKPPKPERTPKARKPSGRKALPAHLEAETHALRPDTCEHCGSDALDAVDDLVEEKLHVVKEHQRRRVIDGPRVGVGAAVAGPRRARCRRRMRARR